MPKKSADFTLRGFDGTNGEDGSEEAERTKRRRRMLAVAGGIIFLLLAVAAIVALVVLIPRVVKTPVRECQKRKDNFDSFVCVCTADYCDDIEEIGDVLENGNQQLVYFLTSRDEHRLKRFVLDEGNVVENAKSGFIQMEVRVNDSETFQSVLGFGGAFTDAVGVMLNSLNPKAREELLRAYFDKETGIRYTIGRTPIASCDFSTRIYSYMDVPNDFDGKYFGLTSEDLELKIPHIITAREMAGESQFRMYATPWSPPWWMKESEKMEGGGPLKGKVVDGDDSYYRTFATYFRLYFEEYAKRGIKFWALTLANEPTVDRPDWWQSVLMDSATQREFAYNLLAPELQKSAVTKDLLIMAHDGQRDEIGKVAKTLYANDTMSEVFAGLAVHWYSFSGYEPLQEAHHVRPDKFILGGEACVGDQPSEFRGPQLGNWTRGWMYGHDILNDMRNWVVGWVDWNLCLGLDGGPNWYKNTVDTPIVVNQEKQEFYKQPLFYFLAHFSRFVPVNSFHITSKLFTNDGAEVPTVDGFFLKEKGLLEHIAFSTPDGHIVLVLLNGDADQGRVVSIQQGGKLWRIQLPADSIATAIWKQ